MGITKFGNRHLRKLLIEVSHTYSRGSIGYKSKDFKTRQSKSSSEIITYADKATERLMRKYYKMIFNNKKYNVAMTAIARELACFILTMMIDNISLERNKILKLFL